MESSLKGGPVVLVTKPAPDWRDLKLRSSHMAICLGQATLTLFNAPPVSSDSSAGQAPTWTARQQAVLAASSMMRTTVVRSGAEVPRAVPRGALTRRCDAVGGAQCPRPLTRAGPGLLRHVGPAVSWLSRTPNGFSPGRRLLLEQLRLSPVELLDGSPLHPTWGLLDPLGVPRCGVSEVG